MSIQTITTKQLAESLQVSTETIRRWVRQGNCPKPLWLGPGCVRFREADIAKWLETEAFATSRSTGDVAAAGIVVEVDQPDDLLERIEADMLRQYPARAELFGGGKPKQEQEPS